MKVQFNGIHESRVALVSTYPVLLRGRTELFLLIRIGTHRDGLTRPNIKRKKENKLYIKVTFGWNSKWVIVSLVVEFKELCKDTKSTNWRCVFGILTLLVRFIPASHVVYICGHT